MRGQLDKLAELARAGKAAPSGSAGAFVLVREAG